MADKSNQTILDCRIFVGKMFFEYKHKEAEAKLIYVTSTTCHVCKTLKPKIKLALEKHFSKMTFVEMSVDTQLEETAQLSVFSVPTILVYFDGKELFRYSRNLSIDQLIQDIQRPYSLCFDN